MTNDELREAIKYARWNVVNASPGKHYDAWLVHLTTLLALEAARAAGSAPAQPTEPR